MAFFWSAWVGAAGRGGAPLTPGSANNRRAHCHLTRSLTQLTLFNALLPFLPCASSASPLSFLSRTLEIFKVHSPKCLLLPRKCFLLWWQNDFFFSQNLLLFGTIMIFSFFCYKKKILVEKRRIWQGKKNCYSCLHQDDIFLIRNHSFGISPIRVLPCFTTFSLLFEKNR